MSAVLNQSQNAIVKSPFNHSSIMLDSPLNIFNGDSALNHSVVSSNWVPKSIHESSFSLMKWQGAYPSDQFNTGWTRQCPRPHLLQLQFALRDVVGVQPMRAMMAGTRGPTCRCAHCRNANVLQCLLKIILSADLLPFLELGSIPNSHTNNPNSERGKN